ncbi:MAG: HU family DNA-binding protein [Rhodospirillales bacterium]|nr:HU family DNA-binding protein [Rhodospirillales bacterium]
MAKKPAKKPAKAKVAPASKPAKRYKATPEGINDRQHLTGIIQTETGCTAKAAKETLAALIGTITVSLKKNQKVQLVGFGSFGVAKRAARKGRNPQTGESIRIKASKSVRFKAGQALKRAI